MSRFLNLVQATIRSLFRSNNKRSPHRGYPVLKLEERVLPAALVNPTTLRFQDVDGDDVTVTLSHPILTPANVNSVFNFDTGNVNGSNAVKQQLLSVNLTGIAGAQGTTLSITARPSAINGGDDLVNVGQIDATNLDIGNVTIDGDLGRILAGDATTATQGLGQLTAYSIGVQVAATQYSAIQGAVAGIRTITDIANVRIDVTGGLDGGIGSIRIGGYLLGGAGHYSGYIQATGNIGAVTIANDLVGGSGAFSGSIRTDGSLLSLSIGGSLTGGSGNFSGYVLSLLNMGPVRVQFDVLGGNPVDEFNTGANYSGQIQAYGSMGNVSVGGNIVGGNGFGGSGGNILGNLGMGSVTVGEIRGGSVSTNGNMGRVTVAGSLSRGIERLIGSIGAMNVGPISIGGDIDGGYVGVGGNLAGLRVAGSVLGGTESSMGQVFVEGNSGAVMISGSVTGNAGFRSGFIGVLGQLTSITIGGGLTGGAGFNSGSVSAVQNLGTVLITGDIRGGAGDFSGQVRTSANLSRITVNGSVLGGAGLGSGGIRVLGDLATATITGNVIGGNASGTANLTDAGTIHAGRITRLTIGGSLIAGFDTTSGSFANNGAILSDNEISSLTINGDILGNATSRAIVSARGQLTPSATADVAINRLTVAGRVDRTRIQAGYDSVGTPVNADAQIGTIIVGDWIASDLVAGAVPGTNASFGDLDDAKMSGAGVKDEPAILSRIGSISITGFVIGSGASGDHFGFVAEIIVALKVGGLTIPLLAGPGNDNLLLSTLSGDIRLNEI